MVCTRCGIVGVVGPRVRAHDRPVVAYPAAHVERPHAVGAHVAECHGFDWFGDAPGCHQAIVGRPVAVGEGTGVLLKDEARRMAVNFVRPPVDGQGSRND
jgi:hypothetical protein